MNRYAILAAAALLLASRQVLGFTLLRVDNNPCGSAQNLFWPPAVASVDTSHMQPPEFAAYARQAYDRWNQAVSTFRFNDGQGDFCDSNDGITSMGFSQTVCDGSGFGGAISVTFYRFNSRSGEFLDADVTFDPSEPAFDDQALFTQIAMHELGHVLGLGHSDECGASGEGTLMQSVTYLSAPRLDRPQADDIAGALVIYGGDPGDGTVPDGANGCAIGAGGRGAISAIELVLLPLSLLVMRGAYIVWQTGCARSRRRCQTRCFRLVSGRCETQPG